MHSPQHWPASKICTHNMQKEARQHPPGLSFEFKPSTSFCYNCSCSGVLYELQNTRAVLRHQQQPWPVGKLGPGAHSKQHSGLKQLNSDIHLLQEKKKIICSASKENHNKQLQLYRSEKELLPCCFRLLGSLSHPEGLLAQSEEFGFPPSTKHRHEAV